MRGGSRQAFRRVAAVALLLCAAVTSTLPQRAAAATFPDLFTLFGDAGDLAVGAATYSHSTFTVTGDAGRVEIKYNSPDLSTEIWDVVIAAPSGEQLGVGFYEDAKSFQYFASWNGLSVLGHAPGSPGGPCSPATGRFVIDEITVHPDATIASLVAHWEHHCASLVGVSFGSVSWNGSTALSPMDAVAPGTFPSTTIDTVATAKAQVITNSSGAADTVASVTITGTDAAQFAIVDDPCTGTSVPDGGSCNVMVRYAPTQMGLSKAVLTVTDTVHPTGVSTPLRGTATIASAAMWADDVSPHGGIHRITNLTFMRTYLYPGSFVVGGSTPSDDFIALRPPAGGQLAVGTYEAAELDPLVPGKAGFEFRGHCQRTARVTIDEIEWGTNGELSRIAARWEDVCNGTSLQSFGAVSVNSSVQYRERALSTLAMGFGQTELGMPVAPSTFTIHNVGALPMHVNAVKLAGTNPGQFALSANTCIDATIAADGSCSVTVRYAPKVAGDHSALLIVDDDISPSSGPTGGEVVTIGGSARRTDFGWVDGESDDPLAGGPFVPLLSATAFGDRHRLEFGGTPVDAGGGWSVEFTPPIGKVFTTTPAVFVAGDLGSETTTRGGMRVTSPDGSCDTGAGRVAIDELTFKADGTVKSLVARWEYHCYGLEAASFGAVRVGTTRFVPVPELTDHVHFDQVLTGTDSAPQTVTLHNRGLAPLVVGTVGLTGPDVSQFRLVTDTCSNTSLAIDASCTMTVRFHPTGGLGEKIARLTVPNSAVLMGKGGSPEDVLLRGSSNVADSSNYGELVPLAPARLLDTRTATGGRLGALAAGTTFALQVTGRAGVPATDVLAVVVNVTATAGAANTSVVLWADGTARPPTPAVSMKAFGTAANLAVVKVGANGKVDVANLSGYAQVAVDVVGFYSASAGRNGSRFHAVKQAHTMSTSAGVGVPKAPMRAGTVLSVKVTGRTGIPATGVSAVVLQVSTTKPAASTKLTLWGAGFARPVVPNLTLGTGVAMGNLAVVRLGPTGTVSVHNSGGSMDVTLDVVGYYTPVAVGGEGRYIPITPARSIDGNVQFAGETWFYRIGGRTGVAHDAAAPVMTVTAVSPTATGALRVFPEDYCTAATTTNVLFSAGRPVSSGAWTPISQGARCTRFVRSIQVASATGPVAVAIDVSGYFTH